MGHDFILTNYFCLCMKWRNFICFRLTAKCKHHKHNFMITCYLLEMSVSSLTHTTSLLCNLALIFDPSWLMFLFNLNNLQNMHDASKLSHNLLLTIFQQIISSGDSENKYVSQKVWTIIIQEPNDLRSLWVSVIVFLQP